MSEKQEKIYGALAAIMAEVKPIGKDSMNAQQGFRFRGVDAVMNHLHPIFAKHGVFVLPFVTSERTEERQTKSGGNLIYRVLTLTIQFMADDGSHVQLQVVSEGMDSGDKAANKALAVGLKYALTQMLLLPYDEIDPDSETPESTVPKTKEAAKETPPPPAKTVPPATEECGEIEHIVEKPWEKNGKSGLRYGIKVNGQWHTTFDDDIADRARKAKTTREEVRIGFTTNGKWRDVEYMTMAGSAQSQKPAAKRDDDDLPF